MTTVFNLNKDVLKRHTIPDVDFFILEQWSSQILGRLVLITVETLGNTNLVASRYFKMNKKSLPVEVRRSKTPCFKRPI